jgi:hypothetical protein
MLGKCRAELFKKRKPVPRKNQENCPIDRDIIDFSKHRVLLSGENQSTAPRIYGSASGEIDFAGTSLYFGV